uniref:Uncharacterized protein n=1 Tax=viral metagenome TaxID=1070528 RepID=A0A6M3IY09_9ZZZZ
MEISVSEKSGWVSDLIFRELKRFEEDAKVSVDCVNVVRVDNRITSVGLDIRRSEV